MTRPHESASVPGVSESCLYNEHPHCRGCACDCHQRRAAPVRTPAAPSPEPPKTCPQCGATRPAEESFCRRDGAHLLSPRDCPVCRATVAEVDAYCWACGEPLSRAREAFALEAEEKGKIPLDKEAEK